MKPTDRNPNFWDLTTQDDNESWANAIAAFAVLVIWLILIVLAVFALAPCGAVAGDVCS